MFSQIAFGAGALFLGCAVTIALLFYFASRTSPSNRTEGCYTIFLCGAALLVGAGFFVVGLLISTT